MKCVRFTVAAILAGGLSVAPAAAQSVKIGMITTLSGGGAALGIDVRDAFQLALKERGGKLGGTDTQLLVADDAMKVESAKQIADRFLKQENVDIVTGIIWSNLALAVVPGVTRAGKFYISPNAGPSQLAGKDCHPNYFNVAWQNDNLHEAMGQYVNDLGKTKVYLLAPNYPAGRDALNGFKRFYKSEPAAEVYTQLGQTDYSAEIANLRAAKPDAVFIFLPGGMGINFVKQYSQAGMIKEVPLFGPGFSFSEDILKAVGEDALGVFNTSQWNHDLDNEANRKFVEGFRKEYGRTPTLYASQGYDAALAIDAALKATGGKVSDADAFREALRKAEFQSVRGKFAFGPNHHPVQDIHVLEVVKAEGGGVTNKLVGKVFTDHRDAFVGECKM